jgi:Tfp pilus assembly protein PilZ
MSPASQSFRFRESRRLLREVAVRLSALGEDGELSALTRDIATGGMFVSTPAPMPVGAAVHFVLQLGSDDEPADVEGEATVVWVRPEAGGADQPAGMGMQFSRVEPGGEERLALLFSERQAEADVIPPAPAESPPPEPPGDDLPSIDPPLAAEDAAGADEVEATHADLFGELAEDGDNDWMKPESSSRPWLWPAVGGAVILVVALIVLRGPLLQLVGVGGAPTEESAPADVPSFEISTTRAGADVPPEGAEESSTSSRLLVPLEEGAADAEATAEDSAAEPAGAAATEAAEGVAAERPAPAPPTAAVETRTAPAAEPAAARPPSPRPSTAAPAAAPANATALRSITVSTTGDRTVIEIVGNAPFQRHHIMPLQAPPRLVVRLIGVREAYDASAVNGPRLRGVRTGVHGRGATRNLHVVLDLAASDIAATVERRGDRVVVNLSD